MSRKDNKNRVLKKGESQRADGSYMYRYTDSNGKQKCVYDKDLNGLRVKEDIPSYDFVMFDYDCIR